MFNVSDDFRTVMKAPAQRRRLYGTVGDVSFTQKNVLQGTFTITNQCSDTSNIQIGQAYIGELKATFRGLEVSRKSWKGKEIVSYQGLEVNGKFEDVLLGHFFIDSAKWTKSGITVTAYDAMSKFDKGLEITQLTGTPYEFATLTCNACGVEFGMTQEEVEALNNGNETLGIYEDNEMESYRDFIAWLAQSLGANAIINREGKLIFKQYGADVSETFNSYQRLDGGKFSDFDTFYTGLSVVNINQQTTTYYGAEVDNGLTMNLGSNPLLQYGTDEIIERQRRAILAAIQKIDYTPMTMKLNTPLIYDLMDSLEFTGGLAGENESLKTTITKYVWKFNGDYEIECVGADPVLASGRSKVDKNISGLLDKVDGNKTITYKFTNAKKLEINDTPQTIIAINFTSKEKTTAIFLAQVLLNVKANEIDKEITGTATYQEEVKPDTGGGDSAGGDSSGSSDSNTDSSTSTDSSSSETTLVDVTKEVKFSLKEKTHPIAEVSYKINNTTDKLFVPNQVYHEGNNILTLYYPLLSVPDNTQNRFEVMLKLTDGLGEIKQSNILATIFGQGLAADLSKWDGTLDLSDTVDILKLNGVINISSIVDKVNVMTKAKSTPNAFSDNVGIIKLHGINISGISDTFGASHVIQQQTVKFALNDLVEYDSNNKLGLRTTFTYESTEGAIDSGKMTSVKIMTSDKQSVQGIEVKKQ